MPEPEANTGVRSVGVRYSSMFLVIIISCSCFTTDIYIYNFDLSISVLCKGDSSIVCEAVVINFIYKFRSIIFKNRRPLTVQRVNSSCQSFSVTSTAQGHLR